MRMTFWGRVKRIAKPSRQIIEPVLAAVQVRNGDRDGAVGPRFLAVRPCLKLSDVLKVGRNVSLAIFANQISALVD